MAICGTIFLRNQMRKWLTWLTDKATKRHHFGRARKSMEESGQPSSRGKALSAEPSASHTGDQAGLYDSQSWVTCQLLVVGNGFKEVGSGGFTLGKWNTIVLAKDFSKDSEEQSDVMTSSSSMISWRPCEEWIACGGQIVRSVALWVSMCDRSATKGMAEELGCDREEGDRTDKCRLTGR